MSPPRPITPFAATAATITTRLPLTGGPDPSPDHSPDRGPDGRSSASSYGDRGLDAGVRVVALQPDVLEVEGVEGGDRGVEVQDRQRPRLAAQLQPGLLQVVAVEV